MQHADLSQPWVMTHNLHKRFNSAEAESRMGGKQTKIQTTKGPHKNARYQLRQHVTNKARWHVVGEKAEIERLLAQVSHIGAKVGGLWRVRRWEVTADGDKQTVACIAHCPRRLRMPTG